ncbi:MAG: hypothetical protein DRQ62_07690 [Gammaproteobacteria bacterium]|nr:MAG: hypothetical protein DRQ62_07690 [Gammaproteobacteria bacterium]
MHATIPTLPYGVQQLIRGGTLTGELNGELGDLFDRTTGRLLAQGMATMIKLGFGFLVNEGLTDKKEQQAEDFFNENFVIQDPNAPGGIRYYQGKFLIRTKKPEDDMNVYIQFCPDPENLYLDTPLGRKLNPQGIVSTQAIDEAQAEQMERDPEQVDLVLRFKDIQAILGLVERPDADVVQLLLDNLIQISGNFGHMFKFGAIGKNAQLALAAED